MNGAASIEEGIKIAKETIASGKAYEKLQEFVKETNN
jgi:anthranilate phosphoribosyltransferase